MNIEFNLEIQDHVGVLHFQRGKVNAMDRDAKLAFGDMIDQVNANHDIHVLILHSMAKGFTAGSDVKGFGDFSHENIAHYLEGDCRIMDSIKNCRVPVIMALNRFSVGLGVGLAYACDLIIAEEGAVLKFPEILVGSIGGADFLDLLVPDKIGRYMAYTGAAVPVEDLVPCGVIHKVVPEEALLDECIALGKVIAANHPRAVELMKELLNQVHEPVIPVGVRRKLGIFAQHEMFDQPDRLALIEGFLGK